MFTKVGVVYATVSGMVRRIIVPDTDSQLDNYALGTGESILTFPKELGSDLATATAQVKAQTGIIPAVLTCAVVDVNSNVIGLIPADPAVDTVKNNTLVLSYSPLISIGSTYNAKTGIFTTPSVTINSITTPGQPIPIPVVQVAKLG